MYFSTILAALLPVGVALAAQINITVGENGTTTFTPDSINAVVGDILNFNFVAGNHTITQSSFASPCSEFTAANGTPGVDSGFRPGSASSPAVFSFEINSTAAPLWFYCRHPGHCEAGMVFAVNAPTTGNKTFNAFQSAAKALSANSTSTSAPSAPSSSVTAPASTSTSTTTNTNGAGAIRVGGAAAALGLVGAIAGLVL